MMGTKANDWMTTCVVVLFFLLFSFFLLSLLLLDSCMKHALRTGGRGGALLGQNDLTRCMGLASQHMALLGTCCLLQSKSPSAMSACSHVVKVGGKRGR
jgi:hypothetical protein